MPKGCLDRVCPELGSERRVIQSLTRDKKRLNLNPDSSCLDRERGNGLTMHVYAWYMTMCRINASALQLTQGVELELVVVALVRFCVHLEESY